MFLGRLDISLLPPDSATLCLTELLLGHMQLHYTTSKRECSSLGLPVHCGTLQPFPDSLISSKHLWMSKNLSHSLSVTVSGWVRLGECAAPGRWQQQRRRYQSPQIINICRDQLVPAGELCWDVLVGGDPPPARQQRWCWRVCSLSAECCNAGVQQRNRKVDGCLSTTRPLTLFLHFLLCITFSSPQCLHLLLLSFRPSPRTSP